jgi:hypothetical protein
MTLFITPNLDSLFRGNSRNVSNELKKFGTQYSSLSTRNSLLGTQ